MLQRVIEFAKKNIPYLQPGFGPKRVKWRISININSTAVVEPYGDGDYGSELERCPEYPANLLQGGGRCHFLVDTLQVMLLLLDKKDDPEKYQEKHTYFTELLKMASNTIPELIVAADLFADSEKLQLLREHLNTSGAKPTDKAFFIVGGFDPLKNEPCLAWWTDFRESLSSSGNTSSQMLCFLSGDNVVPETTHPKISGLKSVGGRGQDILIGFDKKAFASFSLEQSTNCAMSENAVNCYSKGLDFLISKHSRTLAGTKVVHWFKEAIPQENDPLWFLSEPPELTEGAAQQSAREILESLRKGQRPVPANNRFYAMTVSGASGRVMVRDWMEGSFEDLVSRIEQWFADLEIVARNGEKSAPEPKFMAVCGAMVRDLKDLPAPTASTLWRVALAGLPIPQPFIAQALARFRADIIEDKPFNHARMGLIKAYFIRKGGNHNMCTYLNKEHPDPAYQCGRLLAVLASLQYSALGDVGASVVQRYYVAASQTPGLTIGRLISNAKNHLNKLDGGLAFWYEDQIAEIMSCIQDRIPATLDLERQSLFALGYYQQIAANRAGSKNNITNESKEGGN
ncbi:MAG: type I-C CRISPR-associated protein Cas8c/Csd1 [Nitrospirae bacterium]|nr:type I-C CRISPR-associated protein Cas8c/Csd1 [Nitrospirota bacterium]